MERDTPEPKRRALRKTDLLADPIEQLRAWLAEARATSAADPEVMTLATATESGRPSARVVLLRGLDHRGLVFFTNYRSRKGRELERNPNAALLFHWAEQHRQVRVEGRVERTTARESRDYFDRRPLGSRLSAIISPQSEVVSGRDELERRVRELAERHRLEGLPVERPDDWGGYRLVPDMFEFWQSGIHRLHDRLRYRRAPGGRWHVERLAP